MKIAVVNGSSRKGNSYTAIHTILDSLSGEHQVEIIEPAKLHIAFCKGCEACGCANGCVDRDDTNPTVDKIVAADLVLFVTPVYWWGVSAQLKLILDKCYCRGALLRGKKVGIVAVGGSPVGSEQYALIKGQFDCIVRYLGWTLLFYKPIFASDREDLAGDPVTLAELKQLAAAMEQA